MRIRSITNKSTPKLIVERRKLYLQIVKAKLIGGQPDERRLREIDHELSKRQVTINHPELSKP